MIQIIKNNAFARNSLILFTGSMAANVLGYLFHLLLGRMVSITIYGQAESLFALANIISVPAAALTMVATKFSAADKASGSPGSSAVLFHYLNKKIFKYGLPLLIILIIFSPYFSQFFKIKSNLPIIFVWITLLISLFSCISGGILNGWQKFAESSWATVAGAAFKLVAVYFLIKLGLATGGILGSFMLSVLVSYLIILYFLKFIFSGRDEDMKINKKIFDFSSIKNFIWPVLIGNLALSVLSNVDMMIAKHNIDDIASGQYGALTIVSKIIFFATSAIVSVLFAMSAENHYKKTDSVKIIRQAAWAIAILSLGALAVYFMAPNLVMWMLFGNKYNSVAKYLGPLAISVVLFSFVNLFIQYLLSLHITRPVYFLFSISVLFIVLLLVWGRSIPDIIGLTVLFQLLALIGIIYYIIKNNYLSYDNG